MVNTRSIEHEKRVSSAVHFVSAWAGSVAVNVAAVIVVVVLLALGVGFRFPHWWEITVHSVIALVSLVMLFVIQHTTNQHTNAILLKLDELIHADEDADDEVIDAEERTVDEQHDLEDRLGH